MLGPALGAECYRVNNTDKKTLLSFFLISYLFIYLFYLFLAAQVRYVGSSLRRAGSFFVA